MNILQVRGELRRGRSLFQLPLRVTFYARVSTDKDEQLNSLENQVQYYTQLIQAQASWTYVPGYVDEGISGTSTKRRDSFLRMVQDAKKGLFDFIITKEISRFSRSTLDSIHYTQELLEHDVGVLFQNDNINTLDPDSEFRLTIMAGVAQDEVRKLSQRLRFGFHQAIQNGRVLGNDQLWGYDKKGCTLTINQREAAVVRRIFDLYANHGMGVRKISQTLWEEGITSRRGNPFNEVTIRHMLCNPKYKGWYCGAKSQTVDYRTKRRVFFDESQWVAYPDPVVPAIVSPQLWDRAHTLYQQRSAAVKSRRKEAQSHNHYPYSGKLLCAKHGENYHRRAVKTAGRIQEVWECRVYHQRGRAGCDSPRLYTAQLDQVLGRILPQLELDRQALVETVVQAVKVGLEKTELDPGPEAIQGKIQALQAKKERLVELRLEGILTLEECKARSNICQRDLERLETQLIHMETQQRENQPTDRLKKIRAVLEKNLSLQDGIDSHLAASILQRGVVKQTSTHLGAELELTLVNGARWRAFLPRKGSGNSLEVSALRNSET